MCSDGETGLTKYHMCFFEKYIEPHIENLLTNDSPINIEQLAQIVFNNFPNCSPIPIFDSLHAGKTARARLFNDDVFFK